METKTMMTKLQSCFHTGAAQQNLSYSIPNALHWRHNDHDGVSNHQPHGCLQSFIRAQIKENIKAPRHWPLCGEITGTDEFPAQRASNAENVSIWWRHHGAG